MRQLQVALVAILLSWSIDVDAQGSTGPRLTPEELSSIRSLVGGTTQWAPDGSHLLIGGALGGSDLWKVPADGGWPRTMNLRMGDIAFLQSNQPKYSPDGQFIGYLSNEGPSAELWLHNPADGVTKRLTQLGGRINSWSWSPDSKRVALAGDKFGNYDIWIVDVGTGAAKRLTNDLRYEVFPSWTPDGLKVVYTRMDDRWLDHDVMEQPVGGGAARVIVSDTDFFDYQAGGNFGYPLVSPNGQQLLFRSHRSGWINYWVVSMHGGQPRQVAPEAANQSGARWSPDGKSILYLALWNGMQDLRVVSASGGTPRVLATPPGGMGMVSNGDLSPDGQRVSYSMETPTDPADLYVVPLAGGSARQITHSAGPEYITRALIRPRKVSYKSPDGTVVPAYLYEPRLERGVKAPGVLYIHGGPTSSFNDTYQAEVQHLAMNGYAVLLPNIRGSSGYGKRFEDANNGCWGRCDLIDVTAGVEYLRTLPFVDGANMGITGTSYGGCMSLAAAAFAPGVFQAAAAVSGYGDWIHMIQEQELRHLKLVEYEFGPLATNPEVYKRSSPFFYIKDIQTPIMLLHGVGQQLPRSEASKLFADRLEMAYKPFVYKTYPGENYYIRRRENQVQMFKDIAAYFDQHLKGRRSASAGM